GLESVDPVQLVRPRHRVVGDVPAPATGRRGDRGAPRRAHHLRSGYRPGGAIRGGLGVFGGHGGRRRREGASPPARRNYGIGGYGTGPHSPGTNRVNARFAPAPVYVILSRHRSDQPPRTLPPHPSGASPLRVALAVRMPLLREGLACLLGRWPGIEL